jgi:hypothetical protein
VRLVGGWMGVSGEGAGGGGPAAVALPGESRVLVTSAIRSDHLA